MSSTRVCPQAHLLRCAAVGASVVSDRCRIRGEAETSAEMPGWRCTNSHLHTPRDPDTRAETDAQAQGIHRATKPEKYTHRPPHRRKQADIQSDPQT